MRLGVVVSSLFLWLLFSTNDCSTQTASRKAPVSSTSSAEHWDILSLSGNDLHSDEPLLGEKDTFPTFTRELIRVQWRKDDPIDLYVIRPISTSKPPVVLFLYGYPSDTDRFLNNAFCETLTRNGMAAIGFVSALTGPRYHDRPMKEWFVSELQESLVSSVHDVQMILSYLAARGDLDMDHVGMFGQGSGGTIAILAAGVDPRIKALDLMDPWGDWPDWLATAPAIPENERASYLKPDFLRKVAPLDPVHWLPLLKSRPIRLQEALFLDATPEIVRNRLEEVLPAGAERVEYKDAKEYVEKVSAKGKMLDWLHEQLQAVHQESQATGAALHASSAGRSSLRVSRYGEPIYRRLIAEAVEQLTFPLSFEDRSEVPPVRVLFPAPFAPAMSAKPGAVTAQLLSDRIDVWTKPSAPVSPQGAGGPRPAFFSLPRRADKQFGSCTQSDSSPWHGAHSVQRRA